MGYEVGWRWAWFLAAAMAATTELNWAAAEPEVPCYFIFGDSLVDSGNNNGMKSLAMADYLPYGIDFPGGPSGRFCNGKTSVDAIADQLGFSDPIPSYAAARGREILGGVNFASAAGGIRNETGYQLGVRTGMNGQVRNYQSTVAAMVELMGGDEGATAEYLKQCVYTVGMGSNDYLNNYFMPYFYTSSRELTPEQFADALIAEYHQQIRILYNYGARRVGLIGVGPVGCTPNELAQRSSDGATCVGDINDANQIFNGRLRELAVQLNREFPDAAFTFLNVYKVFGDILSDPASYGIRVTNAACCGVGRNKGQITCLPLQPPCHNRREYLFWDAFHPTEATNLIIGRRSYAAESPDDAYPMDIRGLLRAHL